MKEEEKENRKLKEENLLMTNKTDALKVRKPKINLEGSLKTVEIFKIVTSILV